LTEVSVLTGHSHDLGTGSDPTFSIDELAKKKKKYPTDKVWPGNVALPGLLIRCFF